MRLTGLKLDSRSLTHVFLQSKAGRPVAARLFAYPSSDSHYAKRGHGKGHSALLLLVLGVLADDHHAALALDDLALLADGFDRGTNLHVCNLLIRTACGRPRDAPALILAAPRNAAARQIIG